MFKCFEISFVIVVIFQQILFLIEVFKGGRLSLSSFLELFRSFLTNIRVAFEIDYALFFRKDLRRGNRYPILNLVLNDADVFVSDLNVDSNQFEYACAGNQSYEAPHEANPF